MRRMLTGPAARVVQAKKQEEGATLAYRELCLVLEKEHLFEADLVGEFLRMLGLASMYVVAVLFLLAGDSWGWTRCIGSVLLAC